MKKTSKRTVKPDDKRKGNSGRKPVADKLVQISIYIRQSQVDKMNGIASVKEYATNKVNAWTPQTCSE